MEQSQKVIFVVVLFASILNAFLELLSIGMMFPFMTAVLYPEKVLKYELFSKFFSYLNVQSEKDLILIMTFAFLFSIIFSTVTKIFTMKLKNNFTFLLGSSLALKVYHSIMSQKYGNIKSSINENLTILTSKIDLLTRSYIFSVLDLISSFIILFIFIVTFVCIDVGNSLFVFFSIFVPYFLITQYYKK